MHLCPSRHFFAFLIIVFLLVSIDVALYFSVSVGVTRAVSASIWQQLGHAVQPLVASLPSEVRRANWETLARTLDQRDNSNGKIGGLAMASALFSSGAAVVLIYLLVHSSLGVRERTWVLIEVGCITLGFVAFNLFFYRVIVKGTEHVTASALLTEMKHPLLRALELRRLQREARCLPPILPPEGTWRSPAHS